MREIAVIISKKALEGVYSIRGIRRNLDSEKDELSRTPSLVFEHWKLATLQRMHRITLRGKQNERMGTIFGLLRKEKPTANLYT